MQISKNLTNFSCNLHKYKFSRKKDWFERKTEIVENKERRHKAYDTISIADSTLGL